MFSYEVDCVHYPKHSLTVNYSFILILFLLGALVNLLVLYFNLIFVFQFNF
jgi:hypothetical protein